MRDWHKLHQPSESDLMGCYDALIRETTYIDSMGFGGDVSGARDRLGSAVGCATSRRFLEAAAAETDPQKVQMLLLRAEICQVLNQNFGPPRATTPGGGFSPNDERLEQIKDALKLMQQVNRISPM